MRNLVVRVSIVASLSGCAMNPEAAERFAAALAGASQAYNLGYAMGGGQPLAPRQQDWDWAWDQFYSDGYLAWACRGMLWSNLPGHLNRWKIHHLRSNTWQQENERHSTPA